MKTKLVLVVGLVALLTAVSGYARQTQPSVIKAQVDFPFIVEGKTLPAGTYEFSRPDLSSDFRVTGPDHKGVLAPIMTRLSGEMHTTPQDSHLVFDKVGEICYLSEIWIPGEDGYLLFAAKGIHTHKVLNVKY